jgi:hypothetical protein
LGGFASRSKGAHFNLNVLGKYTRLSQAAAVTPRAKLRPELRIFFLKNPGIGAHAIRAAGSKRR